MEREFWGPVLEASLKSSLTFVILQLLGNDLSLIERLESWKLGLAKISASSYRNLLANLSVSASLEGFKTFKLFAILSGDFSKNSKFKSLNVILS